MIVLYFSLHVALDGEDIITEAEMGEETFHSWNVFKRTFEIVTRKPGMNTLPRPCL